MLSTQDDAQDAKWFDVNALPPLAFDHKLIVRDAFTRLSGILSQGVLQSSFGSTEQEELSIRVCFVSKYRVVVV